VGDISRDAGVSPPAALRLVFHPTVEAFARATGSPWWTTGVSRGTSVDLLPPDVLRQRGVLERTLRHEIAHVMTARQLEGRPLWVLEGAAIFFSGALEERSNRSREQPRPRPYPSTSGGLRGCPSDDEMARSRSADAMRSAYDRAAACFQRELRAGKRWLDVGK
jgi:hypothetical protein